MLRYKIAPRGFAANCYLLTEDGKTAVAIDPAQPRVADEAARLGLRVEYALLTHGHFDHIGGCAALQQAGAKIGCLDAERPLVLGDGNMAAYFGRRVPAFGIDFTFSDGDVLELCGIKLTVIATPGHTAGGACFLAGGSLFTGDTLFAGDVGRCDLPTGSGAQLAASVQKLYALEGDLPVFPGHGEDTTLGRERKYNGSVRQC